VFVFHAALPIDKKKFKMPVYPVFIGEVNDFFLFFYLIGLAGSEIHNFSSI